MWHQALLNDFYAFVSTCECQCIEDTTGQMYVDYFTGFSLCFQSNVFQNTEL